MGKFEDFFPGKDAIDGVDTGGVDGIDGDGVGVELGVGEEPGGGEGGRSDEKLIRRKIRNSKFE